MFYKNKWAHVSNLLKCQLQFWHENSNRTFIFRQNNLTLNMNFSAKIQMIVKSLFFSKVEPGRPEGPRKRKRSDFRTSLKWCFYSVFGVKIQINNRFVTENPYLLITKSEAKEKSEMVPPALGWFSCDLSQMHCSAHLDTSPYIGINFTHNALRNSTLLDLATTQNLSKKPWKIWQGGLNVIYSIKTVL